MCMLPNKWFSAIQCLLKGSFEALPMLFMQLIGIFCIDKGDHVHFPWPFPCLKPLLKVFDEPGSCRIRLLHDIYPLDVSKIGFFERAHHLHAGQTKGWKVMVPERPAVGFSLNDDKIAGLPGFFQTFQSIGDDLALPFAPV